MFWRKKSDWSARVYLPVFVWLTATEPLTPPTKHCVLYRSGDMLTAHTEKVPESLVSSALVAAAVHWSDKTIGNYTSVENTHVENVKGTLAVCLNWIFFLTSFFNLIRLYMAISLHS